MASRGESSALWDGVGLGENNAENKGEDEKQTHFVRLNDLLAAAAAKV